MKDFKKTLKMPDDKDELYEPSVCIAGIGGIGGYLAALLCHRYENKISLLARGERAECLKKQGVTLNSELMGKVHGMPKQVVSDAAVLGRQDVIIICVKNYSLDSVCRQLKGAVGDGTILVPAMNGLEAGERLGKLFPQAIVLDAVVYCNAKAEKDYSISQKGGYARFHVGSCNGADDAARYVSGILEMAGVDCRFEQNIMVQMWKKYIFNCAFNSVATRYSTVAGEIRKDKNMEEDFEAMLLEAWSVGKRRLPSLPESILNEHKEHLLHNMAFEATSSLRWDVEKGGKNELDAFLGALIRMAEKEGIEIPVTERYNEAIQKLVQENQKN